MENAAILIIFHQVCLAKLQCFSANSKSAQAKQTFHQSHLVWHSSYTRYLRIYICLLSRWEKGSLRADVGDDPPG
ncbi:MAG: hypothetical protein AAFO91_19750, partial [Bacteroidota bacterium]